MIPAHFDYVRANSLDEAIALLVQHGDDAKLLANWLRTIAQRTPAANIRNWCITRARHLEESTSISFLFRHRFSERSLAALTVQQALLTLRVLLDPQRAFEVNVHVVFHVDEESAGLHVRRCVAAVTNGDGAEHVLSMSRQVFNDLLSESRTLSDVLVSGELHIVGDEQRVREALGSFDLASLRT